ncbi:peptidase inhibitor family I36 protein [Motilibacter aurantiacus]|uniref:peptidase inhibitor family I36 protein n=1 Tax=Motilibacter aurantiacus TaxID=2714955 RepID=UPI00140A434F|nr:peptidase inhibitor family I36 protein [Motilibacter aurantiacus]NHC47599.1 peptidase inhibitor family I36 protein [Motilibacter aurantiacus]
MTSRNLRRTVAATAGAITACSTVLALPATASAAPGEITDQLLIAEAEAHGARVSGGWAVFPNGMEASLGPAAYSDCPNNYVCLFENASWGGRLIRWYNANTAISDLGLYTFNDELSSWVNNSPYDARWFYNSSYGGTTRCMNAESGSPSSLGGDDDKASSFRVYTDAVACT